MAVDARGCGGGVHRTPPEFYLVGLVPLYGISLLETGVLGSLDDRGRRKLHATFVGVFLIVAHVAMICGMLNPPCSAGTPDW